MTPEEDLAFEVSGVKRDVADLQVGLASFAEDVNGNLTKLRADVNEAGTFLSEAIPAFDSLSAAVDDHAKRLQQDTETLLELTENVNTLLELMPNQPKYQPVDWVRLTADEAAVAWTALGEWIAEVLVPRYYPDRRHLPDCWAYHPGAVEELSWLRTARLHAFMKTAGAVPAAEWHVRWRESALKNVRAAVDREVATTQGRKCAAGRHLGKVLPGADPDESAAPDPQEGDDPEPGADDPTPWARTETYADPTGRPVPAPWTRPLTDEEIRRDPENELAQTRFWWPHFLDAMERDVAERREREREAAEAAEAADQAE